MIRLFFGVWAPDTSLDTIPLDATGLDIIFLGVSERIIKSQW